MKKITSIILFSALFLIYQTTKAQSNYKLAQKVILDRPYVAGELTLYPVYDPNNTTSKDFRYVPNKIDFDKNPDGSFKFSFIKYSKLNTDQNGSTGNVEKSGGGYVHSVIKLKVEEDVLEEARQDIASQIPGAKIVGPVVYEKGTFYLINKSTLGNDPNTQSPTVLGVGTAPTVEGSSIAVAFELTPDNAQIFEQSLKTPKPDISFNFNMNISGYYAPRQLNVKFNTEKIKKIENKQVGASIFLMKYDNKKFVSQLQDKGAIEITGAYLNDDQNINDQIDRIVDLFFQTYTTEMNTVQGDTFYRDAIAKADQANLYTGTDDRKTIDKVGEAAGKIANKSNAVGAILSNIEFKYGKINYNMNKKSDFTYSLNNYMIGDQTYAFGTGLSNLGDDFSKYIKEIDLSTPNFYTERDIMVEVLGINNIDEFNKALNSVLVKVKKVHADGNETVDDVYIGSQQFEDADNFYKAKYPFVQGDAVPSWYDYSYKIVWNYKEGSQVETDWISSSDEVIRAVPPYIVKTLEFIADPLVLNSNNIRLSNIKVMYDLGDAGMKSQSKSILTSNAQTPNYIDILSPPNQSLNFTYEINRVFNGSMSPVNLASQNGIGDYIIYDQP